MATKRTFDCVAMKHQAQQKLRAEWERRGDEFDSYEAFLEAGIRQCPWMAALWKDLRLQSHARVK